MAARKKKQPAKPDDKLAAAPREEMALADIDPAPYNPRSISDEALAGLSASVREFGLVQDLVWNRRTGRLVAGHQRLRVLLDQDYERAEVVVVDLDEAREKALNVTLNNPHVGGEFTDDLSGLLASLDDGPELGDLLEDLNLDLLAEAWALPELPPELAPDQSDQLEDKLRILIMCDDEGQQRELLERFEEEGLKCRAYVL